MSEEEIIEIIEAVTKKDTYWLTTKEFEAMIGLLDLYNKQKEANKLIVYNFEKLVDKYEELSDKYFKLLGELNNEQRY